jgi:hypothetical protein
MPIRICVWNIFEFTNKHILQTHYANNLLDFLHPAGAQAFDVIAIIEPRNRHCIPPGDAADGEGTLGILTLLTRLQLRHAAWRVAPPLSTAHGTKSETIALFYDSTNIELCGPNTNGAIPALFDYALDQTGGVFWHDTVSDTIRFRNTATGVASNLATGADATSLAVDGNTPALYWCNNVANEIWMSDIDGQNAAAIIQTTDASHIQVESVFQKLYWIDDDTLFRSDLDGTNEEEIIGDNADPVRDYYIDPTYDRIYWAGDNKIQYCTLNGTKDTNLVNGITTPSQLLADMQREYIYWVDTGANRIQRFGLKAGANVVANLVTAGNPRHLRLDLHHAKMYWVRTGTGDIWWADLNGANAAAIVAGENATGIAIDPARNRLYWTTAAAGSSIGFSLLDGTQINPPNYERAAANQAPAELLAYRGDVNVGQCEFVDGVGNNIVFPQAAERRPMLFRLRDNRVGGPNNEFMLLIYHAPKPEYGAKKKNKQARRGVKQLQNIQEITANRGVIPVVVAGDFNCCPVANNTTPGCNHKTAGHGLVNANALATITNVGGMNYNADVQGAFSSISPPGPASPYNDFKNHAYDNIFSIGFAAVANAQVDDLITTRATAFAAALPIPVLLPALPLAQFQIIHRRHYKNKYTVAPAVQESGISDHLPVKITVTL